jgi:hypothetical protein
VNGLIGGVGSIGTVRRTVIYTYLKQDCNQQRELHVHMRINEEIVAYRKKISLCLLGGTDDIIADRFDDGQ